MLREIYLMAGGFCIGVAMERVAPGVRLFPAWSWAGAGLITIAIAILL